MPQKKPNSNKSKSVAVIVAHPDDETLWTGGRMLSYPTWQWFTLCLCRGSDADRAPKFYRVLKILQSAGIMGDLDDGPEQIPLADEVVQRAILDLLPPKHFDLIITHSPAGEYTRHRRHEEVSKAVIALWNAGKILADELWMFAYEDGNRQYLPRPMAHASIFRVLPASIWLKKYRIITDIYGFKKDSFEAETTPHAEAFWQFTNPQDASEWLKNTQKTA